MFFHTLLNLKRFQKEPSAVLTLDRWSIKALKGDFAMAAVLLHPIIMSCEKHINLRVDKNMCARTSFPPPHLAALIIFMYNTLHQLQKKKKKKKSRKKKKNETVLDNDVP